MYREPTPPAVASKLISPAMPPTPCPVKPPAPAAPPVDENCPSVAANEPGTTGGDYVCQCKQKKNEID